MILDSRFMIHIRLHILLDHRCGAAENAQICLAAKLSGAFTGAVMSEPHGASDNLAGRGDAKSLGNCFFHRIGLQRIIYNLQQRRKMSMVYGVNYFLVI